MTSDEIKLRQLTNQYLVTPADKKTVVEKLCGIQAQFMPNARHSLKIRCNDFAEDTWKDGLVKNWTIRGTVHVFAKEDLSLFLSCCGSENYRRNEWDMPSFWNQRDCWALTPQRQAYFSEMILESLKERAHTREELKSICREHGMTEPEESSMFDPWGGGIRELCERGFIHYVVQEEKAYCLSPVCTLMPKEEAELELARRYFTNIAPATIHDAMYFFHTSATRVKQWLSCLPVISAECGGKTYYYIENGKRYDHDIPKCLFLAGFDQLMLGYEKKESLYLKPEHQRAIFSLSGIVMSPILLDGHVVGKWKKKNRKWKMELFETLGEQEKRLIRETAESLWDDLASVEMG